MVDDEHPDGQPADDDRAGDEGADDERAEGGADQAPLEGEHEPTPPPPPGAAPMPGTSAEGPGGVPVARGLQVPRVQTLRPRPPLGPGMGMALAPPGILDSGIPAQWAPDPTERHQLRWWNGRRWTDHVADDGTATTDPLP